MNTVHDYFTATRSVPQRRLLVEQRPSKGLSKCSGERVGKTVEMGGEGK